MTLRDFPLPTLQFHEFPGLENEITKFLDFPGFPRPIRTPMVLCVLEQLIGRVNNSNISWTYYK